MASTTPQSASQHARRPSSQTRKPSSRPTTPLRPLSRGSLRGSLSLPQGASSSALTPIDAFEPAFAELSDSMADLEANMMYLGLMHESLARFSESFASFLYGMNMNAFCVDFPEAPVAESFKRPQIQVTIDMSAKSHTNVDPDIEATFLTTDTSFVDNPPSSKMAQKFQTPAPASRIARGIPERRGPGSSGGRGGRTGRGSGLARATNRGRVRASK